MPRSLLRAALLALLLTQTGCFGWARLDAGFTTSTTLRASRQGAALGADFALGESKSLALDVGVRGKASKSTGDGSITVGALYFGEPDPVTFYGMGGVNLFQVGSTDGDLAFGMGSPFAEAGIAISPSKRLDATLLTIGTRIEYDLRFTRQPHEGFWTANVGFALGGRAR